MIYEAILSLFPDIQPWQFSLRDDGDGPYISSWTYPAPQPTQAELNAAATAVAAAARIAVAHARINTAYENAVNELIAGYPEKEVSSWPKQEAEARAFLADETATTPWLKGAAAARGINVPNFAALVIRNADALAPLHGALTGKRQRLRDEIDALGGSPTQEQLDAIQWA